jgi:hypothetical protein
MPIPSRKIRDAADADACLDALGASGLSLTAWVRTHRIDARSLNMWRINRGRSVPRPSPSSLRLVELVTARPAEARLLRVRLDVTHQPHTEAHHLPPGDTPSTRRSPSRAASSSTKPMLAATSPPPPPAGAPSPPTPVPMASTGAPSTLGRSTCPSEHRRRPSWTSSSSSPSPLRPAGRRRCASAVGSLQRQPVHRGHGR